jgi:NADP-dependent 3-hydroxy acid dehydrogenase YdfG
MGECKLESPMKLLIISGASAGIGMKTAELFLTQEYTVAAALSDRCGHPHQL